MGNVKGIPPGDVQRMSAGRGVQHSEFNHAPNETTHFFQIWIEPNVKGIAPATNKRPSAMPSKQGVLRLVASPDGAQGSVLIHADARMYSGLLDGAQTATLALDPNRKAYVHLVRGAVSVNGVSLTGGDAALLEQETKVVLDQAGAPKCWFLICRRSFSIFCCFHKEYSHGKSSRCFSFGLWPHPAHGAIRGAGR
jgi:redox-sensitive bicupin YhaK (pirin superfamily)